MSFLNHTMLRIRDPAATLAWYKTHFGMNVLTTLKVDSMGFTNYFLAIDGPKALSGDTPWFKRQGILELCHNHNAEETDFVANNGNKEPHRGFGHICFSVNNLSDFCQDLEKKGVKFQKRLSDGRQKNIAFALDPNGYWVELIENSTGNGTRFNHSMIRVKDKEASLKFYQDVLGMKLVNTSEHKDAKFTLYFLSFPGQPGKEQSDMEGLIELTHNWGTEEDKDFKYHDGNQEPKGFGHFGVSVDDVIGTMEQLEAKGAKVLKRVTDGKMKFVGFVADPDGYWIEILPKMDLPDDIFTAQL